MTGQRGEAANHPRWANVHAFLTLASFLALSGSVLLLLVTLREVRAIHEEQQTHREQAEQIRDASRLVTHQLGVQLLRLRQIGRMIDKMEVGEQ